MIPEAEKTSKPLKPRDFLTPEAESSLTLKPRNFLIPEAEATKERGSRRVRRDPRMTQPPDRPYALSPIGKREIEQFGIEIVVLGIPQQLVQPTAMLHPVEQPGLRSLTEDFT